MAVDAKPLHGARQEGEGGVKCQCHHNGQAKHDLIGLTSLAFEVEPDIGPAAVARIEHHPVFDQHWDENQIGQQHQNGQRRGNGTEQCVDKDRGNDDQTTFEDLFACGVVVKVASSDPGVLVEIFLGSHLCLSGVDPKRNNRKKNLDDPNAKPFPCVSTEFKLLLFQCPCPKLINQRGFHRGNFHN